MTSQLMTRQAAAKHLGLSDKSLERAAADGSGPPFIRIGARRVAYDLADVEAWAAGRKFRSLAHEAAGKKPAPEPAVSAATLKRLEDAIARNIAAREAAEKARRH